MQITHLNCVTAQTTTNFRLITFSANLNVYSGRDFWKYLLQISTLKVKSVTQRSYMTSPESHRVQLTLEQHEFELRRSTYIRNFFQ